MALGAALHPAVPRLRRAGPPIAASRCSPASLAGAGQRLPRRVRRLQPIVATLALLVAGRGLALVIAGGQLTGRSRPDAPRASAPTSLARRARSGRAVRRRRSPSSSGSSCARTAFGRRLRRHRRQPGRRELAGLPVRRVADHRLRRSAACSPRPPACSPTARLGASDPSFVGLLIELSAITAVVVGGTPLAGGQVRVLGTVAGRAAHAADHRHPDPAQPAGLDRPDGPGRSSSSPPSTSSAGPEQPMTHRRAPQLAEPPPPSRGAPRACARGRPQRQGAARRAGRWSWSARRSRSPASQRRQPRQHRPRRRRSSPSSRSA